MNTTVSQVAQHLESIAPLSLQESYDNSGLLVGDKSMIVKGVLCALDITEQIILEAEKKDLNLIVVHHPIIFSGLKRLTGSNVVERSVILAIQKNIAIYAAHTNLDNISTQGVNTKIAERLNLQSPRILLPKFNDNDAYGSGMIGSLEQAMQEIDFLHYVKERMQAKVVRHTAFLDKLIQRVAICGGSGKFLLSHAIDAGADIFISADFKYHDFFEANDQIVIADIGHYESEQFTIELLKEAISSEFCNFAAHCTNLNTNPINYF